MATIGLQMFIVPCAQAQKESVVNLAHFLLREFILDTRYLMDSIVQVGSHL